MKYTFDLADGTVVGPYDGTPDKSTSKMSMADYVKTNGDMYPFRTGILPITGSGILSIQRALGYEQIIYQLEPSINLVKWGQYENDHAAKFYNLAMPWHIVIADFKNNNFVGARHFFSVNPIFDWSQPLLATNLPNTNTTGYRGNSMGWVCLYHTLDTRHMTFNERLHYAVARIHGVAEPYNDNNMSETDGPRFYQQRKAPSFMWDPKTWADKSKKEGFEWTLDESLWIPLMTHPLTANGHHEKYWEHPDAIPYTLDIAANHPYSAYYHDHDYVKPFMIDIAQASTASLSSILTNTAASGEAQAPKQKKVQTPQEIYKELYGKKVLAHQESIDKVAAVGSTTWACPHCDSKFASKQAAHTVKIYTSLDADVPNEMVNWDESSYQERCSNCAQESAYIAMFDVYVDTEIAAFSSYWEEWFLADWHHSCSSCGEVHPWNNNKSVWVYENIIEQTIGNHLGCIACYEEPVLDVATGQFFVADSPSLFIVTQKQLVQVPSEPGTVSKPFYTDIHMYCTTQPDQNLCPTFYNILQSDGTPLELDEAAAAAHCPVCASKDLLVFDGTPESNGIPSLI